MRALECCSTMIAGKIAGLRYSDGASGYYPASGPQEVKGSLRRVSSSEAEPGPDLLAPSRAERGDAVLGLGTCAIGACFVLRGVEFESTQGAAPF